MIETERIVAANSAREDEPLDRTVRPKWLADWCAIPCAACMSMKLSPSRCERRVNSCIFVPRLAATSTL